MGKGKERDLEAVPEFKIRPGGPWAYRVELYPRDCYGRQIMLPPQEVLDKRYDTICGMIIAQGGELVGSPVKDFVKNLYKQHEVAVYFFVKKIAR